AIVRSVGDATFSVAKFAGAVNNKLAHDLGKLANPPAPSQEVSTLAASTSTPADTPAAKTAATPSTTTNAVVSTTTSKAKSTKGPRATAKATPPAAPTSDPEPSETPKPKPVEATKETTTEKDGNKATPGTTAVEHSTTGDNAGASSSGETGTDTH